MSDVERELQWLRTVRDLAHGLASEQDVARLLARVLDAAIELTGAERGFLVRLRPGHEGSRIRVEVARGFDRSDLRSDDGLVSRSVIERVLAQRLGVVTTGADADLIDASSVKRRSVLAILAAPLTLRGEVTGALYLDHRHLRPFLPADLAPLTTFASQAALALETAELRAAAGTAGERLGAAAEELRELRRERRARELSARPPARGTLVEFGRLVGGSPAMAAVHAEVERAARSWEPALVLGESGSGKQAAVEEVHARSPWSQGPLHQLSCPGLSARELELTLKRLEGGASRRARSGARATLRGTLLLDEVGDLEPRAQAAALRLLSAELGGAAGATGCRVIATSRHDLASLAEGGLRADLLYRLDVLRIRIPPLRQRPEDIEPLLRRFAADLAATLELAPAARERLMTHRWPGNVRELQNEVRRLVALGVPRVEEAHLSADVRRAAGAPAPTTGAGGRSLEQVERSALVQALAESGGNKARAARLLGIPRSSLHDLLQRHGLQGPP